MNKTERLAISPPCPDCMRPLHKGKTCVEAALEQGFEAPKQLPLCPRCNRRHKPKEPCPLRGREEEALYRERKW